MSRSPKRIAALIVFGALMAGTVTAQAQVVRPPPPPSGGVFVPAPAPTDASNAPGGVVVSNPATTVDRKKCFSFEEAQQRLVRERKRSGYVNIYRTVYSNNNTTLNFVAEKAGDQWFDVVYDLCRAKFTNTVKLRGRPNGV